MMQSEFNREEEEEEEEGGGGGGEKAAKAATKKKDDSKKKPLLPSLLPRGEKAVSRALDSYFGASPVQDPGTAAGGSSVAEMANLLVER